MNGPNKTAYEARHRKWSLCREKIVYSHSEASALAGRYKTEHPHHRVKTRRFRYGGRAERLYAFAVRCYAKL